MQIKLLVLFPQWTRRVVGTRYLYFATIYVLVKRFGALVTFTVTSPLRQYAYIQPEIGTLLSTYNQLLLSLLESWRVKLFNANLKSVICILTATAKEFSAAYIFAFERINCDIIKLLWATCLEILRASAERSLTMKSEFGRNEDEKKAEKKGNIGAERLRAAKVEGEGEKETFSYRRSAYFCREHIKKYSYLSRGKFAAYFRAITFGRKRKQLFPLLLR